MPTFALKGYSCHQSIHYLGDVWLISNNRWTHSIAVEQGREKYWQWPSRKAAVKDLVEKLGGTCSQQLRS